MSRWCYFLTLIYGVGLSTILYLICGKFKGCSCLVGGGGGAQIAPREKGGRLTQVRFSLFEPKEKKNIGDREGTVIRKIVVVKYFYFCF